MPLSLALAACVIGQIASYRALDASSLFAGMIIGSLIAQLSAELDAPRGAPGA